TLVAHDLRQPVSVIALSAQALQRRGPSPESSAPIERIRAAAQQVSGMVDDLLDVSYIESHQLTLRRRNVELCSMVQTAVDRARETLPPCEVHSPPGAQYSAWADPARIEQVLVNLLANAANYREPGSPIEVDVKERAGKVEIVVTNRGPGIAPE